MVAKKAKYLLKGFSLIEVIIFIAILALFFVSAMAVVTYSVQVMKSNEYKIKASIYAEELMEWIKAQKEINWTSFVNTALVNNYYCFNTNLSGLSGFPVPGGDCGANDFSLTSDYNSTLQVFRRNVKLTTYGTPVNKVEIYVQVQWKEPGGINSVPLDSYVTIWE